MLKSAALGLLMSATLAGVAAEPSSAPPQIERMGACTEVRVKATDGAVVTGRSMEFAVELGSHARVMPRGVAQKGSTPKGGAGISWTNRHGYVYVDGFGLDLAADGLNEAGLSVGALYLPGFAAYQPLADGQESKALNQVELASHLLGTCATVAEVRALLPQLAVWEFKLASPPVPLPLHWSITDASGAGLIVQFTKDGLHFHDNVVGVLTNSPDFAWHLVNLRNYVALSPMEPSDKTIGGVSFAGLGQGSGMIGLPGDFTPQSRFVRAAVLVRTLLPVADAGQALSGVVHIMNAVDIPHGAIREEVKGKVYSDYTQWTAFRDHRNARYLLRTYGNTRLRQIDLRRLKLEPGSPRLAYALAGAEDLLDVSGELKPAK